MYRSLSSIVLLCVNPLCNSLWNFACYQTWKKKTNKRIDYEGPTIFHSLSDLLRPLIKINRRRAALFPSALNGGVWRGSNAEGLSPPLRLLTNLKAPWLEGLERACVSQLVVIASANLRLVASWWWFLKCAAEGGSSAINWGVWKGPNAGGLNPLVGPPIKFTTLLLRLEFIQK